MTTEDNGPYLQVAVICEKTLEEKDGVISIIRIVDRITVTHMTPDSPEKMPEIPISYTLVISLNSGGFKGKKELRIVLKEPNGKEREGRKIFYLPITFEGDGKGNNVILNNVMQTKGEGVYWFEIFLDDNFYAKTPLRIDYKPEKSAPLAPPT